MFTKKALFAVLFTFLAVGAMQAQQFKYVGAAKCKMCHLKAPKGEQYNVWLKGPHANAFKTLSSPESLKIAKEKGIADPTKDPGCLKCHTTTGHIEKSVMAGVKPTEGVSCESCHGPGSRYKGASIMKNKAAAMKNGLIEPDEAVCKTCHNTESPTYKPFDFAKKSAMIAHPDPSRK